MAMATELSMPGPCIVCGDHNYPLSCGGPLICPKCDCGHFDAATVEKQTRVIAELRALAASQAEQIAGLETRNLQWGGHAADAWLYATAWMRLHDQLMGWIQERPEVFKDFWDSDPRGSLPSPERVLEEKTSLQSTIATLAAQVGEPGYQPTPDDNEGPSLPYFWIWNEKEVLDLANGLIGMCGSSNPVRTYWKHFDRAGRMLQIAVENAHLAAEQIAGMRKALEPWAGLFNVLDNVPAERAAELRLWTADGDYLCEIPTADIRAAKAAYDATQRKPTDG